MPMKSEKEHGLCPGVRGKLCKTQSLQYRCSMKCSVKNNDIVSLSWKCRKSIKIEVFCIWFLVAENIQKNLFETSRNPVITWGGGKVSSHLR